MLNWVHFNVSTLFSTFKMRQRYAVDKDILYEFILAGHNRGPTVNLKYNIAYLSFLSVLLSVPILIWYFYNA